MMEETSASHVDGASVSAAKVQSKTCNKDSRLGIFLDTFVHIMDSLPTLFLQHFYKSLRLEEKMNIVHGDSGDVNPLMSSVVFYSRYERELPVPVKAIQELSKPGTRLRDDLMDFVTRCLGHLTLDPFKDQVHIVGSFVTSSLSLIKARKKELKSWVKEFLSRLVVRSE